VTAASEGEPPATLIDQLAEGGIMVCPVRRAADDQMLVKLRRENGKIVSEDMLPVRFVPLVSRARPTGATED
jgi:protein-L-isoaspartate(D-aspartate) O-methyltransferase